MNEPQFFDAGGKVVAFARRSDPDTSHAAANDVSPFLVGIQAAVLDYAAECEPGGFIDPMLNARFDCAGSSYRSRRAELVDRGLIADTGARRTLDGKGRRFIVWRITPAGLAMLGTAPPPLAA